MRKAMAVLKKLEGWPHRYRWRAMARAAARMPYEFKLDAYPVLVCREPAVLRSFG